MVNDTPRTIERLSLAARYARPLPALSPPTTALVIIDMQNVFAGLWEDAENQADLRKLMDLTESMRQAGCTIIRTQHGHADPDIDGGEIHRWWGSSIIEGSEPHRFMSGFEATTGDMVIPKRRYNAFHGTDLDAMLKNRSIQSVIIGGVMTNLCCETTARDAFCRDYSVIFLVDGTATVTENMQTGTLLNLGFGFAHLKSCYGVRELLCP